MICYLFGQPIDKLDKDKDHIPPRGIFPKEPKGNLITVYAHYDCNHKFQEDDEHIRNLIMRSAEGSKSADAAIEKQVIPSFQKNRGAKNKLEKHYHSHTVKDKKTGDLIKMSLVNMDDQMLMREVDRWVRGIYFHHLRKPLNPNEKVIVTSYDQAVPNPDINRVRIDKGNWHSYSSVIEKKVFAYCLNDCESHGGIVYFLFFDRIIIRATYGKVTNTRSDHTNKF